MDEISLHILDILQNSIKAQATLITLRIDYVASEGKLTITVEDNGKGMDENTLANVCSPFTTSRTTRRVGFGLPLFKTTAELTGGSLTVTSQAGKGTKVTAVLYYNHIDCPPLGNMTDTLVSQIISNQEIDFVYKVTTPLGNMCFDTREIKKILGAEVSLDNPEVFTWMRESINEEFKEIGGGTLL